MNIFQRWKMNKTDVENEDNDFTSYDTDPFGSYTGVPEEKGEKPIQDVDDL